MPELPEVETVLSGLKQVLVGREIVKASVHTPRLRNALPCNLAANLKRRKVKAGERRAKYILLHLDNGKTLVVHLGMSGVFRTEPPHKEKTTRKHDHVRLYLDDGTEIVYHDPRRFGVMDLLDSERIGDASYFKHLGVEPLDKAFSASYLARIFERRTLPVKQAIMDQKIVVGVGNIYASESLFLSKIDPCKPASSLSFEELKGLVAAIRKILKEAIKNGGSTLRDYRNIGGERGYFQAHFSVYDRVGQPCPNCTCNVTKTGGVKRIVQGGRSTFYCPQKQR